MLVLRTASKSIWKWRSGYRSGCKSINRSRQKQQECVLVCHNTHATIDHRECFLGLYKWSCLYTNLFFIKWHGPSWRTLCEVTVQHCSCQFSMRVCASGKVQLWKSVSFMFGNFIFQCCVERLRREHNDVYRSWIFCCQDVQAIWVIRNKITTKKKIHTV